MWTGSGGLAIFERYELNDKRLLKTFTSMKQPMSENAISTVALLLTKTSGFSKCPRMMYFISGVLCSGGGKGSGSLQAVFRQMIAVETRMVMAVCNLM
jgi:hypothetical protein